MQGRVADRRWSPRACPCADAVPRNPGKSPTWCSITAAAGRSVQLTLLRCLGILYGCFQPCRRTCSSVDEDELGMQAALIRLTRVPFGNSLRTKSPTPRSMGHTSETSPVAPPRPLAPDSPPAACVHTPPPPPRTPRRMQAFEQSEGSRAGFIRVILDHSVHSLTFRAACATPQTLNPKP